MDWNVPISTGQTGYIIEGRSRGRNSELVWWWLHRSREDLGLRVFDAFAILPAERGRTGSTGWQCVWRRASSQAFEAFERSVQITVTVVFRHRFDLQLQSDSRAAESEIKPGRSVPLGQTQECCFEPKQRDAHGVDRSAFICTRVACVEQNLTLSDFWRKPQPN